MGTSTQVNVYDVLLQCQCVRNAALQPCIDIVEADGRLPICDFPHKVIKMVKKKVISLLACFLTLICLVTSTTTWFEALTNPHSDRDIVEYTETHQFVRLCMIVFNRPIVSTPPLLDFIQSNKL